jgi:hypothetical protein
MQDLADRLFDYEAGELTDEQVLELFADLIQSGWIWHLQGRYQREAYALIHSGFISPSGELQKTSFYEEEPNDS